MEALFDRLKHPNPNLRDRAMLELVETRDETTIPRLIGILDEDDTTYRRAAVKTLGAIGMDTIPFLIDILATSDNVTVRGSAVKAIAQVIVNYPQEPLSSAGLECLKTAMSDDNPVVNIAAVMALGELGSPAFEIMVEALETTDNIALQVTLVNTLASLGDVRAEPILVAASQDATLDEYVRESATSALPRMEQTIKYKQMKAQRDK
ncbi:HEAT repeat domain-containing protein [Chamaesiphon sp. OTE_8_metabat_110]|uniref:HEAT repeat domain-containing protein n=2 Tax=unclassified Chamaesiphon TaxID=2620921 RepID=UPI00286AC5A3|nr:HEAT repeat domain-containing protein [Chamaesiphon sp. OTE_8_metabat_110]